MKKLLVIITIILLIIALCIFYNDIVKKKEVKDDFTLINNLDDYKKIEKDNITNIKVDILTEGGKEAINISDKDTISEIYDAIGNIKIGVKSYIRTSDNSRFYTFISKNNEMITYSFEGNNIILNDEQYNIKNYSILKNINIEKYKEN